MTKLETLEEKYFERLEENGVKFVEIEDLGEGYTQPLVKEEYLVSPKEMCEYLDMPEWIIEWTLDMLKEEDAN